MAASAAARLCLRPPRAQRFGAHVDVVVADERACRRRNSSGDDLGPACEGSRARAVELRVRGYGASREANVSIDHKAWLFDHAAFDAELAPVLFAALDECDFEPIRAFVAAHHASMRDPRSPALAPLGDDWEAQLADIGDDERRWADVALARYCAIDDADGLSQDGERAIEDIEQIPALFDVAVELVEGRPFGPGHHRLDPGRSGTGLLSAGRVAELAALLDRHLASTGKLAKMRERLRSIYARARDRGRGLLLTDFSHDTIR
jgi:hypothetical protein